MPRGPASPAPPVRHILKAGWLGPGQPLITCHLGSLTPGLIYRVEISSRQDLAHKKNYYLKIKEEEVINM